MLNIWVGNLGKYNEGELVGGWINLPKPKEEIDKFLKEVVGLNEEYEEYFIGDNETSLNYEIGEYENINNLNLLAKVADNVMNMDAVDAYIDSQGELSFEELLNLMEQEEDIPYYEFMENTGFSSKESKMGYEMAEQLGVLDTLKRMKLEDYFDFEEYGKSFEKGDFMILDNGYIDFGNNNVDLRKYTIEDLKEIYDLEDENEEIPMLKIVYKEVGKDPVEMEIEDTLEAKQKLVGGLIECLGYNDDLLLICNEEGKLRNLKPNLAFDFDYIVGNCFVIGDDYENAGFKSLTEKEIEIVKQDLKERAIELDETMEDNLEY